MPIRALTRQLLKVIEWTDTRTDLIAYKFPMDSRAEIMNGSQLIVREGQIAILCKEGKIADIFAPGRHRLETANMPVLTSLMNWNKGFKSPFVCDVYFVNTTLFTGQKWGTANPIPMRDPDFGAIRIRAFGTYAFRVVDAKLLMVNLLGGRGEFTTGNIREKLRSLITGNISNIIAQSKYSALDLTMKLGDFNNIAKERLQDFFKAVGFELALMVVENISFPEEVERAIDARSSVGVMEGKMGSFVAMQQAQAMRDMANNPAGFGGAMMGIGMMGNMGGNMGMNQVTDNPNVGLGAKQQQPTPAQQATPPAGKPCVKCKATLGATARFCGECGTKQPEDSSCPKCKAKLGPNARFCGECGSKVGG